MFLNFQNFSICFLRLILYIQILMYRNLEFLVESVAVVVVLLVSALMLFFWSKNSNYFWIENSNSKASCSSDPLVSPAI